MAKSRWGAKAKALIVLEGLKGKPVPDICAEYQVSQAHYYRWRDKFLANMHLSFADKTPREVALSRKVSELKKVIGELTIELKKNEMEW
jgi:transposase-like protein